MKQRDRRRKKTRELIKDYLKRNLKNLKERAGKAPVPSRCA